MLVPFSRFTRFSAFSSRWKGSTRNFFWITPLGAAGPLRCVAFQEIDTASQMRVIVDTSAFIALDRIGQLDLLRQLVGSVA